MMLNVLLGGEGLVGSALARYLEARGEKYVSFDLASGFDLMYKDPPDYGPEAFYWFLAWDVGGSKYLERDSSQQDILNINLTLCSRIFGWLRSRKADFIFTSSQLARRPDAYGLTKALGETIATEIGGQIAVLWNIYDADSVDERSHVIPDMVHQALSGKIQLRTNGLERRRFLHSDDCAAALIAQRDEHLPRCDIAGDRWVSILEVARLLVRMTGCKLVPGRQAGKEWIVEPTFSPSKWSPRISLEEGLEDVLEKMQRIVHPLSRAKR